MHTNSVMKLDDLLNNTKQVSATAGDKSRLLQRTTIQICPQVLDCLKIPVHELVSLQSVDKRFL